MELFSMGCGREDEVEDLKCQADELRLMLWALCHGGWTVEHHISLREAWLWEHAKDKLKFWVRGDRHTIAIDRELKAELQIQKKRWQKTWDVN